MIAIREILLALNPDIVDAIDNDRPIKVGDKEAKLGGSFTQMINALRIITKQYVGTDVQIKLIPQNNGFVSLPTFCARIARSGNVGIQTMFIGHDLTLSPAEQKKINNANNAAPTNMASTVTGTDAVARMASVLGDDDLDSTPAADTTLDDSDLPF